MSWGTNYARISYRCIRSIKLNKEDNFAQYLYCLPYNCTVCTAALNSCNTIYDSHAAMTPAFLSCKGRWLAFTGAWKSLTQYQYLTVLCQWDRDRNACHPRILIDLTDTNAFACNYHTTDWGKIKRAKRGHFGSLANVSSQDRCPLFRGTYHWARHLGTTPNHLLQTGVLRTEGRFEWARYLGNS
jgi:uncharacterized Zn-finger protein